MPTSITAAPGLDGMSAPTNSALARWRPPRCRRSRTTAGRSRVRECADRSPWRRRPGPDWISRFAIGSAHDGASARRPPRAPPWSRCRSGATSAGCPHGVAGLERGRVADHQLADVHRMEAVDVLGGVEPTQHLLGVDVRSAAAAAPGCRGWSGRCIELIHDGRSSVSSEASRAGSTMVRTPSRPRGTPSPCCRRRPCEAGLSPTSTTASPGTTPRALQARRPRAATSCANGFSDGDAINHAWHSLGQYPRLGSHE
jgi:hypothetical protein